VRVMEDLAGGNPSAFPR